MDAAGYASTNATSDSLNFMITDLASGTYKTKEHLVICRKYLLLHRQNMYNH